jgi:56kDa selenium binding protein (SBP56)
MALQLKITSRRARPSWTTGLALLVLVVSFALVAGGTKMAIGPRLASGSHMAMAMAASTPPGEYLYVWAGDAKRTAPDRLVAIDYDAHSPRYGSVVGTAEVPGPGGIDNEPHHCGLSIDQHILACGGLLSVLRHQNGIFFFDVSHPDAPRFLFSAATLHSSVTDAFIPLPGGGFLVTMMGAATGGSPGRVAEFNGDLQLVHEWPENPPTDGFNPHGIDVRPDRNIMITCDFVEPASTLNAVPGAPVFRGSVRVWDLQRRAIVRTVSIPGAPGTMDCRLIPQDAQGRAYTAGLTNGLLYLVDTQHGTAHPVLDFNTLLPGAAPHLMDLSADGSRLFVPIQGSKGDAIAMFDIRDREHPHLLSMLQLPAHTGPHMAMLSDGGMRLIVDDYFLNEDGFGKVHADGDHRVFALRVTPNSLTLDQRFSVDFNTVIPGLQLRPHGLAILSGSGDGMVMGSD